MALLNQAVGTIGRGATKIEIAFACRGCFENSRRYGVVIRLKPGAYLSPQTIHIIASGVCFTIGRNIVVGHDQFWLDVVFAAQISNQVDRRLVLRFREGVLPVVPIDQLDANGPAIEVRAALPL